MTSFLGGGHTLGATTVWDFVRVGGGGQSTRLNISNDGTTMVSGVDVYGAYIWDFALDRWRQLMTAKAIPASFYAGDWPSTGLREGAYEIVVAPSLATLIFTIWGGYLWRSTDRGVTFQILTQFARIDAGTSGGNVTTWKLCGAKMAVDPVNPNVLYVGTPGNGLFLSSNANAADPTAVTFTALSPSLVPGSQDNPAPVPGPALRVTTNAVTTVGGGSPTVLHFASTAGIPDNAVVFNLTNPSVISNAKVAQGLTTGTTVTLTNPVTGAGVANGDVIAFGGDWPGYLVGFGVDVAGGKTQTFYAHPWGSPVYLTKNAGVSFAATTGGPGSSGHCHMAVGSDGTMWMTDGGGNGQAGSDGSLWKFVPGSPGAWSSVPAAGSQVATVAVKPDDPTYILCATQGGTISYSTDSGANFTPPYFVTYAGSPGSVVAPANDVLWLQTQYNGAGNFLTAAKIFFDPVIPGKAWLASGIGIFNCPQLPTQGPGGTGAHTFNWTSQTRGIESEVGQGATSPPNGTGNVIYNSEQLQFYSTNPQQFPANGTPKNAVQALDNTWNGLQAGWSSDYAANNPNVVVGITNWLGGNDTSWISYDGGATVTQLPTSAILARVLTTATTAANSKVLTFAGGVPDNVYVGMNVKLSQQAAFTGTSSGANITVAAVQSGTINPGNAYWAKIPATYGIGGEYDNVPANLGNISQSLHATGATAAGSAVLNCNAASSFDSTQIALIDSSVVVNVTTPGVIPGGTTVVSHSAGVTLTASGATTVGGGSPTVLHFASTTGVIDKGILTHANIPAGATVISHTGTTVTISASVTGAGVAINDSVVFLPTITMSANATGAGVAATDTLGFWPSTTTGRGGAGTYLTNNPNAVASSGPFVARDGDENNFPALQSGTVTAVDYGLKTVTVSLFPLVQIPSGAQITFVQTVGGSIACSTDKNLLWVPSNQAPYPLYTTDGGVTWKRVVLPGVPIVAPTGWGGSLYINIKSAAADRVIPGKLYLYNNISGLWVSTDSGATWANPIPSPPGGYGEGVQQAIKTVPLNANHLFYSPSNVASGGITSHFYYCTDAGAGGSMTAVANVLGVGAFAFGAPKPGGSGYPTVFISGYVFGVYGIYRCDNFDPVGNTGTWINLGTFANDNLDIITGMEGDKTVYGKCYVSFQGSGFAYGQLA